MVIVVRASSIASVISAQARFSGKLAWIIFWAVVKFLRKYNGAKLFVALLQTLEIS